MGNETTHVKMMVENESRKVRNSRSPTTSLTGRSCSNE